MMGSIKTNRWTIALKCGVSPMILPFRIFTFICEYVWEMCHMWHRVVKVWWCMCLFRCAHKLLVFFRQPENRMWQSGTLANHMLIRGKNKWKLRLRKLWVGIWNTYILGIRLYFIFVITNFIQTIDYYVLIEIYFFNLS